MEMPQDDGLDSLVNSALGEGDGSQQGTPTFGQDTGHADKLTTPQNPVAGQQGAGKLLAGKYKTAQELEKAYLARDKQAGQALTKAQRLDQLVRNPRFMQMAQSDPEMREALGKLGYEMRQEETAQEEQGNEWDGNENSSEFRIAVVESKNELRWELFNFGQQRGKALSQPEEKAIREVLSASPRLSVSQAWKLTDLYEKDLKAREDARASEVEKKFRPKGRPQPNPLALPGQKLDLKKGVTEMNDAERRAYLSQLAEENP